MSEVKSDTSNRDYALLFIGAFAQWLLSALFARSAATRGVPQAAIVTFIAQSLWWVNIKQATKANTIPRWLWWSVGAGLGAGFGTWL